MKAARDSSTMHFQALLMFCILVKNHRITSGKSIECFSGFRILHRNRVVSEFIQKTQCSGSCVAATANHKLNGREISYYWGECSEDCIRNGVDACDKVRSIIDINVLRNASCELTCCDWSSLCNSQPHLPYSPSIADAEAVESFGCRAVSACPSPICKQLEESISDEMKKNIKSCSSRCCSTDFCNLGFKLSLQTHSSAALVAMAIFIILDVS